MKNRIRSIRIFLSSTFSDMVAEREYLVKKTFPAIRKIAKQRQVDFSVVDLRWGVTEKEAHTGKVIEICLDEIKDTHPFFIGLLGERYGWCPSESNVQISERLRNKYPWIVESLKKGMSITEIEMRYGVLESNEPMYANFYIRESGSHTQIDPRLTALRETIKDSDGERFQVQQFSSPQQLGQLVHNSLIKLLDELYPETLSDDISVLLDKQNALIRQHTTSYFNSSSMQLLEQAVSSFSTKRWCVLVTGENGEGKTSLICNWRKDSQNVIRTLLNSGTNTSSQAICHMKAELQQRPYNYEGLIWIIDGLEYLQSEQDKSLAWLNDEQFANINFIFTTNDEIAARNIHTLAMNSGWQYAQLAVQTPTNAETKQIILNFLKQFAKKLPEQQLSTIAQFPLFKNIYLLRLFLSELIQFGSNERLNSFISDYMSVKSTEQLVLKIFSRLENDYGTQNVQSFFRLMGATKKGFSDTEIQLFLRLNIIDWSALSEAVSQMVIFTNGLWTLHPTIRDIATRHYLDDSEATKYWREQILALREREQKQLLKYIFRKIPWKSRLKARLNYWLYAALPETEEQQQLKQTNTDIIWQFLSLNEYKKLASKFPYFHLCNTNSDREVLLEKRRIYNEHPKRFMLLLPPRVLWVLGRTNWPQGIQYICNTELRGTEENIRILIEHIRHSRIPFSLKFKYVKYLLPLAANLRNASYETIEDTWTDTPIMNIDIAAISHFIIHEAPYLPPQRMERVEQATDKLLTRIIEIPHDQINEQHSSIYALMLIVKSFCCCSKQQYEDANDYFSAAVSVSPEMNHLILLRFLIAKGRNDERECEKLIQLQSREGEGEQEQPKLRDNRLFLLYQLQALDHLAHFRQPEMIDTLQKIFALYPDNLEYAHYVRHNLAGLMANAYAVPLAAYIYQEAANVAQHVSIYAMDIASAAMCYWQSDKKDTAKSILQEAIQKIDQPGNEEYVKGLKQTLSFIENS